MSDKYNVYRAYAAFCQRMAHESHPGDRKLSWLQLAADWLALVHDSSPEDSKAELTKNHDSGVELANEQRSPPMADAPGDHLPDT